MGPRVKRIRVALAGLYFVAAFGLLSWFSYNSYFCASERTGRSHVLTTFRLALVCTAWDAVASACGAFFVVAIKRYVYWRGFAPLVSMIVAGLGFFYMPFWINEGYGGFLFEKTWADVSCFFTEGYGFGFLFFIAPALAVATLLREWVILRAGAR